MDYLNYIKYFFQWSRQDINSSTNEIIYYPISFSSECYIIEESLLLDQYLENAIENNIKNINNKYCSLIGFSVAGIGIILAIGY